MEEEQEIYRIVAVIQEEIAVILAIVIKDVVVLLVDTLITAIMDKLFIGEVGSLKVQIEEDYHLRLEETGRFKIIRKLQEITTEKDKTVEEIVPRERHTEDDGDDGNRSDNEAVKSVVSETPLSPLILQSVESAVVKAAAADTGTETETEIEIEAKVPTLIAALTTSVVEDASQSSFFHL